MDDGRQDMKDSRGVHLSLYDTSKYTQDELNGMAMRNNTERVSEEGEYDYLWEREAIKINEYLKDLDKAYSDTKANDSIKFK